MIPNDDPHGMFVFPEAMRQVSVPEDFEPGQEDANTIGITVSREQGSTGNVMVSFNRC